MQLPSRARSDELPTLYPHGAEWHIGELQLHCVWICVPGTEVCAACETGIRYTLSCAHPPYFSKIFKIRELSQDIIIFWLNV